MAPAFHEPDTVVSVVGLLAEALFLDERRHGEPPVIDVRGLRAEPCEMVRGIAREPH
jgi:hypothetical protein